MATTLSPQLFLAQLLFLFFPRTLLDQFWKLSCFLSSSRLAKAQFLGEVWPLRTNIKIGQSHAHYQFGPENNKGASRKYPLM